GFRTRASLDFVWEGQTRLWWDQVPKRGIPSAAPLRALNWRAQERRKCVVLDHAAVDEAELRVQAAETSPDFDDAHLVAIFDVSGCRLLCSSDSRADRFLKDPALYKRHTPPRIYRRADHKHRKLPVNPTFPSAPRGASTDLRRGGPHVEFECS